jgi:hypothetical protein
MTIKQETVQTIADDLFDEQDSVHACILAVRDYGKTEMTSLTAIQTRCDCEQCAKINSVSIMGALLHFISDAGLDLDEVIKHAKEIDYNPLSGINPVRH